MQKPCDYLKENWGSIDDLLRLSLYEHVGKGKHGEYRKEVNISFCDGEHGVALRHRFSGEQGGKLQGCEKGEKLIGFLHTHVPGLGHTIDGIRKPSNNDMTHVYGDCKHMCIATFAYNLKGDDPHVHVDCWTTKENNDLLKDLQTKLDKLIEEGTEANVKYNDIIITKYGGSCRYLDLSQEDRVKIDAYRKQQNAIVGKKRVLTNYLKNNYEKMTDKCSFDVPVYYWE